ncbi:hypothetical protein MKZ38_004661 [Zalerion maritima]|uniref:Uncharacterized protein n=1 Tax=Zalerion maritima TaxID=339359 RepID=A0AAD5WPR5_9PEZI|nr:hypothetical protein MKZ38_004661 [Zalerion maritima]
MVEKAPAATILFGMLPPFRQSPYDPPCIAALLFTAPEAQESGYESASIAQDRFLLLRDAGPLGVVPVERRLSQQYMDCKPTLLVIKCNDDQDPCNFVLYQKQEDHFKTLLKGKSKASAGPGSGKVIPKPRNQGSASNLDFQGSGNTAIIGSSVFYEAGNQIPPSILIISSTDIYKLGKNYKRTKRSRKAKRERH